MLSEADAPAAPEPAEGGGISSEGSLAGVAELSKTALSGAAELPGVAELSGDEAPGWRLTIDGFDRDQERVREALLTLADGRVGVCGAPLAGEQGVVRWVLASGVYQGDGPETHLLTAPYPIAFPSGGDNGTALRRTLDLRSGTLHERLIGPDGVVESVRFACLARPGTVVIRVKYPQAYLPARRLPPPADDPVLDEGDEGDACWMRVEAAESGGVAVAAADTQLTDEGATVTDRVVSYQTDPQMLPGAGEAITAARRGAGDGFDLLLAEQRRTWASRWGDGDIVIEGDEDLQLAVRFALFHLMASAADTGEAAVGARGLTGTSYRGHVFWDSDTYVLPFLAATHPEAARAMLEYRVRRLPAALEAARAQGREGARFPWESARTGVDVTPLSARDRTGRIVPIRTGQLEDHIVAEVAWAASCYVDWTGDEDFARGPGLRLLIETARYWASRVRIEGDAAHIYGVIGPDEYHEPVDDNAFTNVMARWNLKQAAIAVRQAEAGAGGTRPGEPERWDEIAAALVDGYDPDSGLYEQFAGYWKLEPLIIEEVAPRRPIAADLLLGADRVHQSQVLKQADVLMLHHLVPQEMAPDSLEPNLRFYEPRTAHGSSLSPGVHASLFARTRDFDRALSALRIAARMDLDDLTGSTAGGLHLATMGGVWQALAFGFGGLQPAATGLHIDPRLPSSWSALELRVRYRGSRVQIRKERGHLALRAEPAATVVLDGSAYTVPPQGLDFEHRRGPSWEPVS